MAVRLVEFGAESSKFEVFELKLLSVQDLRFWAYGFVVQRVELSVWGVEFSVWGVPFSAQGFGWHLNCCFMLEPCSLGLRV